MMHPHTRLQLISPEKGFGVVATQPIPKGTITWAQDELDTVLSPERVSALPHIMQPAIDTYAFRDRNGRYVLCWDHGRYINHSFRSNCLSTAYGFELAIRDIEVGEELTDDYGYLNIEQPFVPLPEKGIARKVVRPDDVLTRYRHWDRLLREAFAMLPAVKQPLFEVLPPQTHALALRVARGEESMASIKNCYYPKSVESA